MSKVRLDSYYTKPTVVNHCLHQCLKPVLAEKSIDIYRHFDLWVDPAVGDGAFLSSLVPLSDIIGIDISASNHQKSVYQVLNRDYLTWKPSKNYQRIMVCTNPPFGKNSSLAVKFFNHSAKFAECIAFIVPKTFFKASIRDRLDLNFELIGTYLLDDNSFYLPDEDNDYSVPTIFQVWLRLDKPQSPRATCNLSHPDFEFVKDRQLADFAIQRVGVNAGDHKSIPYAGADSSHYFIKVNKRASIQRVKNVFAKADFSGVKYNTAGNPSISKGEIISVYEETKKIPGHY